MTRNYDDYKELWWLHGNMITRNDDYKTMMVTDESKW